MPLVDTDAIVLHVLDYSETSRILRLATREAGVISVLARGARRSRSRFGSALDLFAEGVAHLSMRENRDLQTLSAFDVVHSHASIAADLQRFAAASALAEMVIRFGAEESGGATFGSLSAGLRSIAVAATADAREAGLAAVWHLVSELGFAPTIRACGECHVELNDEGVEARTFSNTAGGVLCGRCARIHPAGRTLPAEAGERIEEWCAGHVVGGLDGRSARAHQRLLREFLAHHVTDGRALRAFDAWEGEQLEGRMQGGGGST